MKDIPIRHINPTQNEPAFSGSFDIRDIRDLLAGKDMAQDLHRHDFFYILALRKGKGIHEIDFTSYKIDDHSVFFMRPGQVHQLTLKAGSTGYLMEFTNDFYSPSEKAAYQILRKAGNKNFCQPDVTTFKKIFDILTYIYQEHTNRRERFHDVIKANLSIFFIELVRNQRSTKRASDNSRTYAQDRLEEFLELLEKHIFTHKQVSQYAGMLNLSNYQLNAITRTTLGKTCSELIDGYIILESKRYLLATSNQVSQIAYHLGFEDVSYFIRFFKKHTGHSPEVFRSNFG